MGSLRRDGVSGLMNQTPERDEMGSTQFVIASVAKQSRASKLDCFVASLLAMTIPAEVITL
jgi:hypothetical protein